MVRTLKAIQEEEVKLLGKVAALGAKYAVSDCTLFLDYDWVQTLD